MDDISTIQMMAAKIFAAPNKRVSWKEYCESYKVDNGKLWMSAAQHQLRALGNIQELHSDIKMYVVGEHISKSISLPVVQVELRNGTIVTIRDNFGDICISVNSGFPIRDTCTFSELFNTSKRDGYFEGFPADLVHNSYKENPQKFSLMVDGYPELMILLCELIRQDARSDFRPDPKPAALEI